MSRRRALVSASRGIGDILRVTPLVVLCARLGYDVDLLLATDYPDVARLFEGAPEVRRVVHVASQWRGPANPIVPGLDREHYDVATFTFWSRSLRPQVRATRVLAFQQAEWLRDGDTASVRALARQLGWSAALPPPFAMPSSRRFDLEPGTVALHPGCKPDWPWKKWHGFDELARLLPHVALVGTPGDLDNARTYFHRSFAWPAGVKNFIGALDLPDTAALIAQSAALVANDSGLMHLGAALGVPTFGIFGITSPAREAMRVANMVAVTKGLPCEAACRRGPWGRRDCEHRLKCLRTLTAEEVASRLDAIVGVPAWTT
jgi:glycosyl transferase family 9 (putative heptosyltransferase)